jgi:hypothetical protein
MAQPIRGHRKLDRHERVDDAVVDRRLPLQDVLELLGVEDPA